MASQICTIHTWDVAVTAVAFAPVVDAGGALTLCVGLESGSLELWRGTRVDAGMSWLLSCAPCGCRPCVHLVAVALVLFTEGGAHGWGAWVWCRACSADARTCHTSAITRVRWQGDAGSSFATSSLDGSVRLFTMHA